jgi:hypothetical protein
MALRLLEIKYGAAGCPVFAKGRPLPISVNFKEAGCSQFCSGWCNLFQIMNFLLDGTWIISPVSTLDGTAYM